MEVFQLLLLVSAFIHPYSWDNKSHSGIGFALKHDSNRCVSFERLQDFVGICFHPSGQGYVLLPLPKPKPYKFKPRYTTGTLDNAPSPPQDDYETYLQRKGDPNPGPTKR